LQNALLMFRNGFLQWEPWIFQRGFDKVLFRRFVELIWPAAKIGGSQKHADQIDTPTPPNSFRIKQSTIWMWKITMTFLVCSNKKLHFVQCIVLKDKRWKVKFNGEMLWFFLICHTFKCLTSLLEHPFKIWVIFFKHTHLFAWKILYNFHSQLKTMHEIGLEVLKQRSDLIGRDMSH